MGQSTRVIGFVSPDNAEYKKHAKVLKACYDADIEELPKETAEYFGCNAPELEMLEDKLEVEIPFKEYSNEDTDGFDIIVSEIPKGVHKIRFENSY